MTCLAQGFRLGSSLLLGAALAAGVAACGSSAQSAAPGGAGGSAGAGGAGGSAGAGGAGGAGGSAGASGGQWVWQSRFGAPSALNTVWASGPDNAWVGGDDGALYHFDGSAWSAVQSHTPSHIEGIWGASANDVWAVAGGIGGPGTPNLVHWDGHAWTPVDSSTPDNLRGIWGNAANDVWAVGASGVQGVIVHYDGSAWSTVWTSAANALETVSGSSDGNVWAAGHRIYPAFGDQTTLHRSADAAWTLESSGLGGAEIYGVWTGAPDAAWAVGYGPMIAWNGSAWSKVVSPLGQELSALDAIWGSDPAHVTAVGRNATIVEWDGTHWTSRHTGGAVLDGVGGSDAQHRWAVGDNGTVFRYEAGSTGTVTCSDVQGQCVAVSACAPGQGHLSDYPCSGGAGTVCCVSEPACGGAEGQCCSPSGATSRPMCDNGAWVCSGNSSPCPQPPSE